MDFCGNSGADLKITGDSCILQEIRLAGTKKKFSITSFQKGSVRQLRRIFLAGLFSAPVPVISGPGVPGTCQFLLKFFL